MYDQGVFVHPPRLGTVRGLSLLFYSAGTHPIPRITASTVACCRPRETSSHFLIEIAAMLVACGPTQKGKIRGWVICTPGPALLTRPRIMKLVQHRINYRITRCGRPLDHGNPPSFAIDSKAPTFLQSNPSSPRPRQFLSIDHTEERIKRILCENSFFFNF